MMRAIFAILAAVSTPIPSIAQDEIDFERDVLPLLAERCFECHQAPSPSPDGRLRQPKGGLRLDGAAWIRRGGDGGAVLVAGAPEDSELFVRTALAADDPDVMPAKGEPLTAAQVATLRRWIAAGAPFGAWQGAAATDEAAPEAATPSVAVPRRVRELRVLAEGLRAPTAAAIARAAGLHGRISGALGDDLRLLTVRYPAHQRDIDDAAIELLTGVREHVAVLDLGRTGITDASLTRVARMPRLMRLDLDRTSVTARGLRRLAALDHLTTINLFGARIGAGGADALASITSLRVVYLWQSDVSERDIERLRAARPDLRVVSAPDLPAPEDRPVDTPRRRR